MDAAARHYNSAEGGDGHPANVGARWGHDGQRVEGVDPVGGVADFVAALEGGLRVIHGERRERGCYGKGGMRGIYVLLNAAGMCNLAV